MRKWLAVLLCSAGLIMLLSAVVMVKFWLALVALVLCVTARLLVSGGKKSGSLSGPRQNKAGGNQ